MPGTAASKASDGGDAGSGVDLVGGAASGSAAQAPAAGGATASVHLPDQTPLLAAARPRVAARRARLTAALVAALGVLFVGLALALRGAQATAVDLAITRAVQRIDSPLFLDLMLGVSALGYAPWSWCLLGGVIALLAVGGYYREIPFVLATEGAGMLVATIKLLVERPRPTDDLVRVVGVLVDSSYPSGHVVSYVVLYGFLFFLVYARFRRSLVRTAVLALLALPVGLIGVSRIALGHHWASDVLGGYALGTTYLLLLVEAYRFLVVRRGAGMGRASGATTP